MSFGQFFSRYPNDTFIETGSWGGGGIESALEAGCFKKIISIELCERLFSDCLVKFKGEPCVRMVLGDSAVVLGEILDEIKHPVTFWLDAHYSSADTAGSPRDQTVLHELYHVSRFEFREKSVVIVDDINMMGIPGSGLDNLSVDVVRERLSAINPLGRVFYDHGPAGPGERSLVLAP